MDDIIHQADQQQFICVVDGKTSRLSYRLLDGSRVDAYSTQVPSELRGRGIAERLVRSFYDWSQAQGLTIIASCSYVDVWLRRYGGKG